MKKIIFILLVMFSTFSFSKKVSFYKEAQNGTVVRTVFSSDNTYQLFVQPFFQTVIDFGNEQVEYAEFGDNIRWSVSEDNNFIRIKTTDEKLKTDLFVKTNKNNYYLIVQSTGEYSNIHNKSITFLNEQNKGVNRIDRNSSSSTLKIENLNMKYTISKRYRWTPIQIYDDGNKTYFVFSSSLQEIPVFMERTDDKQEIVVNWRTKETKSNNTVFEVDKVFRTGILKLGKKSVIIKNKTYQ